VLRTKPWTPLASEYQPVITPLEFDVNRARQGLRARELNRSRTFATAWIVAGGKLSITRAGSNFIVGVCSPSLPLK